MTDTAGWSKRLYRLESWRRGPRWIETMADTIYPMYGTPYFSPRPNHQGAATRVTPDIRPGGGQGGHTTVFIRWLQVLQTTSRCTAYKTTQAQLLMKVPECGLKAYNKVKSFIPSEKRNINLIFYTPWIWNFSTFLSNSTTGEPMSQKHQLFVKFHCW